MPETSAGFVGEFDNKTQKLDSGLSLSYHDEGDSNQTVVLLHGLNAHSGTWRRNSAHFARDKRVIAPSLPPWRKSPQELDITRYVDFVDELISKLNLKHVSVAGNSMGGWIAMRLAILRPDRIVSLILEDSAGVSDQSDAGLIGNLDRHQTPVLIAWGSEDRIIPLTAGKYLHSKLKNSELEIFRGAGHVPHWERPEEFNEKVSNFLRRT